MMTKVVAEIRDNRDSIQGQWQRWRRTIAPENMWDNKGGSNEETLIWKRRWWIRGKAGTATGEIQDGGYGGFQRQAT